MPPSLRHAGRLAGLSFAVALALALVLSGAALAVPPVSSVADKIICQCGCGAVLSQCPHQECGWGIPNKQFIGEQLDKGKTPDELLQYYVGQYGEKILAAPTKKGFNLAAWVTPFVVLIVGAFAIYYLALMWVRKRGDTTDEAAALPVTHRRPDAPEALVQRMEEELKKFD